MKLEGKIGNNSYRTMLTNSAEEDVAALHKAWGTDSKYRGVECERCRGGGYTREDGRVGCHVCGGRGVLDTGEEAHA